MDLNQITLPCQDYAASVAFYVRLGLTQIVDSPPRYARFETEAGTTLSIHSVDSSCQDSGCVIYFEVTDVNAAVDRLKKAGVTFTAEPTDQRHLWREAYLKDPFGNSICLYHAGQNRRYPPWRIGGEQA